MGLIRGFTDEIKMNADLATLGALDNELLNVTLERIGKNTLNPVLLRATFPTADSLLNIEPSLIEAGDGGGKSVPPIDDVIPSPTSATTINFQTGAIVGQTVTVSGAAFSLPTGTVGKYRRFALVLRNTGTIDTLFSSEQASVAALTNAGTMLATLNTTVVGLPLGWVDLECDNVIGKYRTAGSVTTIIEDKVGSSYRINRFGAGGGGGASKAAADAETSARIAADSTLQANINLEATSRSNADSTLQSNINSEITSRQNADSTLQSNINQEATSRANADSTLTSNLNSEITARANADNTLQSNINAEITSRSNADSTLTSNLNSEITARANADSTLQSNINLEATARSDSDSTLTSNLNSEITARTNADSTLQSNINQEATSRANADSTLTSNLNSEITARSNADSTLQSNINAEITARSNADSSEITARTNADSTLTANLNSEITARTNADSTLQSNIDQEATSRATADSTLQSNVNSEITSRQNADSTLQSNINAEITARANADSTLQYNINSETTARANADSTLQANINGIFQGDSSFYLKSIVGTTLTLATGFMLTASGTEFWVSPDLSYSLASYTVDGNYYVYLDLLSFDTAIPVSINGRMVYQVAASNIVLLTPQSTNSNRYAVLGTIQRVGGSWVNQQTIAKFRHDDVIIGADGSLEYSIPLTPVSSVGTVGQIKAGHVLAASSFPSSLSSTQYSFYNLSSVNDGSGNARNFTNNGTTLFTGTNIFGTIGCASFDGTTQWLSSTSSFFNPGDNDFTCGGWFNPASYTSGLQTLFGQWSALGNLSYMVRLTAAGQLEVYASTDGTTTFYTTLDPGVTSGWMHVSLRYTSAVDKLEVFVNSTNVGYLSVTLASVASPSFSIGRGASNNYFAGQVDEFFFTSLLSDNAIAKMFSYKLSPNRELSPPSQRWYFWGLYDSQTRQLPDPIIDIDANEVWWDLSTETALEQVAVKLHNVSSLGYSKPTKARSLEMTAEDLDLLLPITHNLGVVPELSFKTQNLNGDYEYTASVPFVATTTQIKYSGPLGSTLASSFGSTTVCVLNYSTTALSLYVPSPSLIWNTYTTNAPVGALADQEQVFWDTTLGSCIAILPATPTIGVTVRLVDFKGTWGTNNLIVQRDGNKIQGITDDLYLTIPWDTCTLVFDGVDNWHVI